MIVIDQGAYDAMIRHMQAEAPREGVGLLCGPPPPPCPRDTNGDGDCGRQLCPHCGPAAVPRRTCDRWAPLDNASDYARLRYEVDPAEQIEAWEAAAAEGRRPWIVCHSHVSTNAAPSPLDVRYATDP